MSPVDDKNLNEIISNENGTYNISDECSTIIQEFERNVRKYPNKTALIYKEKKYTYSELNEYSNNIAFNLIHKGIRNHSIVGIYMDKTDRYIIAILGVLKAGGTYLPMDCLYPKLRIQKMLEISKAALVIVEDGSFKADDILEGIQSANYCEIVCKKETREDRFLSISQPEQDAYIIFTSGSTGEPKGITIRQSSVLNLIRGMNEVIEEKEEDSRIGMIAPMVFDMSVAQMYYALLNGQTLVVVPDDIKLMPLKLLAYLREKKVNVCDITPQHLYMIITFCNTQIEDVYLPELFIAAGEALPLHTVKQFYQLKNVENKRILNSYGPAECCVYASFFLIDKEIAAKMDEMYIGKPMRHTRIYILDEDGKRCEVNKPGELHISGDGLSTGYINQETLTKEKFVENPYEMNSRMYRSGDIAKWTESGNIVCMGRNDSQVKVRGYRIELGEIENFINKIEGIKQSKVMVNRTKSNEVIVAYFVADRDFSLGEITGQLEQYLPKYMIPTFFIKVDYFKMTINGKIDTKQLPSYTESALQGRAGIKDKKNGRLEAELLELCKKLVEYEDVYLEDNFFQVGGNSLMLLELSIRIMKTWGVTVPIGRLYDCESINAIADLIKEELGKEQQVRNLFAPSPQSDKSLTKVKASDFQKLVIKSEKKENKKRDQYSLHKLPTYNIIQSIKVNEYIDPRKLHQALEKVVKLHGALRSSFVWEEDGYYMQSNEENKDYFQMIYCEEELSSEFIRSFARDFDITSLPLFQLCLFENNKREQAIMLNIHHAVFDYFSLSIFLTDLFQAYQGKALCKENRDIMKYQERQLENSQEECFAFWRNYFSGRKKTALFASDLGQENARIRKDDLFKEARISFEGERFRKLKAACRKKNVSPYILLASGLAILLGSYTTLDDVSIGTYLPGRNLENSHMIGLFTHMLGVRFQMDLNESLDEFLSRQVKNFSQVMNNQWVEYSQIYRSFSYDELKQGELFSVIFNYVVSQMVQVGDYIITADEIGLEPEELPLCIKAFEGADRILCKVKYAGRLYSERYVSGICVDYMTIIDWLTGADSKTLLLGDVMERLQDKEVWHAISEN